MHAFFLSLKQGLFSRITFAQPVLLGGTTLFLNSEHFLETKKSYKGCIRNLEINNKAYNLNPTDLGGDILSGVDTDECRTDDDDCQTLTCQHHGICRLEFETKANNKMSSRAYCECPLGFDGQFCETPVEIQASDIIFPDWVTLLKVNSQKMRIS